MYGFITDIEVQMEATIKYLPIAFIIKTCTRDFSTRYLNLNSSININVRLT